MAFHTWHAFLHMGGYASYVWSAYAFVLLCGIVFSVAARWRLKALIKKVKHQHAQCT
ncbi:MAG: heme exporter protein CcmD [Coxiellaceae bacterium]|nr:heme exporter protein CcmD [Coxiellaceae bacterium]